MGEERSVKLHGFWASPYTMRVQLALKIKGIEFEYIEENISNKSELVFQYNPVHNEVPILVHNGQPISESMVILEYIDETWTEPPYLLPKDPYRRAKLRFWVAYFQPVYDIMRKTLITEGEEHEIAMKELQEKIHMAEQGMKEIFPNGNPSFHDSNPGYLDIVIYSLFGTYEAPQEVFGVKLLTPESCPLLFSWVTAMSEIPVVKEVTPSIPKMVEFLRFIRQKYLKPKA